MICFAEVFFDSWQHEDCNSGLIRLVAGNTNDEIVIAAAKKHLETLKVQLGDITYRTFEITIPPQTFVDKEKDVALFRPIIQNIIKSLDLCSEDKLIFLSSRIAAFQAAIELNEKLHIPMYFVQHAELDEVVKENDTGFTKRAIIERAAKNENNYFITLSPVAKQRLRGVFSSPALDRFIFLHHPVDGGFYKERNKRIIGVYGACGRRRVFKKMLIDLKHKKADFSGVHYIRDVRFQEDLDYSFLFPETMTIFQKCGGLDHFEQKQIVSDFGWILMTYTREEYTLSASGIFADAIRYEIPIVGLRCDYLEYYNEILSGGIGFIQENTEEAEESILNVLKGNCNQEYKVFVENIKRIKKVMMDENNCTINEVLAS